MKRHIEFTKSLALLIVAVTIAGTMVFSCWYLVQQNNHKAIDEQQKQELITELHVEHAIDAQNVQGLSAYINKQSDRLDAVLAYLRRHGIHLPPALVANIPPPVLLKNSGTKVLTRAGTSGKIGSKNRQAIKPHRTKRTGISHGYSNQGSTRQAHPSAQHRLRQGHRHRVCHPRKAGPRLRAGQVPRHGVAHLFMGQAHRGTQGQVGQRHVRGTGHELRSLDPGRGSVHP